MNAPTDRKHCFEVVFFILLLGVPVAVWADDSNFVGTVGEFIKDGSELTQERLALEAKQRDLLRSRQELDARGRDLGVQQEKLNEKAADQNQLVAGQRGALKGNRALCNKDSLTSGSGEGTGGLYGAPQSGHMGSENEINACNVAIRALNQKTADIDDATLLLQVKQDGVELGYALYNLNVAEWDREEGDTVNRLNLIYESSNDWLDRAYALLITDRFQITVNQTRSSESCSQDEMPSGHITRQQLAHAVDYYLACFKRVAR